MEWLWKGFWNTKCFIYSIKTILSKKEKGSDWLIKRGSEKGFMFRKWYRLFSWDDGRIRIYDTQSSGPLFSRLLLWDWAVAFLYQLINVNSLPSAFSYTSHLGRSLLRGRQPFSCSQFSEGHSWLTFHLLSQLKICIVEKGDIYQVLRETENMKSP